MADVYDEYGRRLFSHAELQRALQGERRVVQLRFSAWMRQLNWPTPMLARLRGAHADGDRRTVAMILKEARVLLDAEQKCLTAAAAAIRHELETKYGDHS